jgi:GT2 family glycosyltransferase
MGHLFTLVRRFARSLRRDGLTGALIHTWRYLRRRARRLYYRLAPAVLPRGVLLDDVCISLLMPVFDTPPEVLVAAIASVRAQTHRNWELCICDDASSARGTLDVLARLKGSDPRIKIIRSPHNVHIARATNAAAEFATGQFVAFLDHDDTLEPDALECVVRAISLAPDDTDLLYTDEDKIEPDGSHSDPYFKPDWSPEHLCSVMYVLHLLVVRKKLFLELGGLRQEYTGAQDYDLALRTSRRARRVVHVPRILYHWRKVAGSAAAVVDAKPEALVNARRAIEDHVASIDSGANVTDGLLPGTFRVNWPVPESAEVTLLILTNAASAEVEGRGRILLVENFIRSIVEKSTFKRYRLLVVDNGNLPDEVRARVRERGGEIVSYSYSGKFNYAKKLNFSFEHVRTENVIVLNDDLEVISPDWIEALLSLSSREEIGAAGGRLLYPNGRMQHGGMALQDHDASPCVHVFHNLPRNEVGYYGYTHIIRNYSAVTGAALATRMSLVRKLGGFRESLATDFNDVDFCLRLGALGRRIVYTPYAELFHFEGATIHRTAADPRERDQFVSLWLNSLKRDPYFNTLLIE